jgi:hypothetical protein
MKKIVPQMVARQELTHRLGHGDHQGWLRGPSAGLCTAGRLVQPGGE